MKRPIEHTIKQQVNTTIPVEELLSLLSEKDEIIDIKSDVISSQKKRISILEEALRLSKVKRFCSTSEKSTQGELFNEAEVEVEGSQDLDEEIEIEVIPTAPTAKNKPGRKPFSATLPRHQIFCYLTPEEKEGAVDTFFTKVKEELDIIPAQARVLEYMQEKAVFKTEQKSEIVCAQMPKHPIVRAMGSINLIAYIVIAKYLDGLPLYRMEKILARYGGDLSRATMANWMIGISKQLQPLINLLQESQRAGYIIQADETRIQVLKEPDKSPRSDKYMWVTLGGLPDQKSVIFEYNKSRSSTVPLEILEGFSGYLQTDGYAGYNSACKEYELTHVGCWDHARRKFTDAQAAMPKNKKNSRLSKADMALSYINKLYVIERNIKNLSIDDKKTARQEQSVPLLNKLKMFLEKNQSLIPKDSLTGKALTYLNNQWDKLVVYCENGELNISNILAENAIRPFVIGRKAWLFADTPNGANASAILYSFLETAKINKLEPYDYLVKVLKLLPYADCVEKYEALLPWNIK